jgi:quercetin dioxygenase-like cupin family protein
MMVIQDVMAALSEAAGPVVKVLVKGDHSKVIVLGFKKGMTLREHQTAVTTRLVVIEGQVNYFSADGNVMMNKFDDLEIPVNVPHSVQALDESICFLIQGS